MTALPSDDILTETGFSDAKAGKVLLIACGALAHEIVALKRLNGWDHLTLQCLPAKYHLYPEKIVDAVAETVEKYKNDYASMFVVYADCGTGGQLEEKCKELGIEMIAGPHCYSFFEGNDNFAQHEDEITAFYLTDFLARQFDAFVWKPLGLDRHPELLEAYFGNYEKLVYLVQSPDAALEARARDLADRLGLAYERRETGYGDLETALAGLGRFRGGQFSNPLNHCAQPIAALGGQIISQFQAGKFRRGINSAHFRKCQAGIERM